MKLIDNKILFLVKEYEKLKEEQHKRIEFRDHLTYITLGVIGGVFSFILEKPDFITALLVLPFVCIVLGWTYLINDDKISEIGLYLKDILIPKIESSKSEETISLESNWETVHRSDINRSKKKNIQVVIDIMLFCFSAIFSLITFIYISTNVTSFQIIVSIFETILIIILGYFIITFQRQNI